MHKYRTREGVLESLYNTQLQESVTTKQIVQRTCHRDHSIARQVEIWSGEGGVQKHLCDLGALVSSGHINLLNYLGTVLHLTPGFLNSNLKL